MSARSKANNKWNSKAYDRIALNLYKGEREVLKEYVESQGKTVNQFLNELIVENCQPIREMRASR